MRCFSATERTYAGTRPQFPGSARLRTAEECEYERDGLIVSLKDRPRRKAAL